VDIVSDSDVFRIAGDGDCFFFRKDRGNRFVVTKLSKTNNANVIFSISLKRGADFDDIRAFENELASL
jgi:hypothetical protein